MAQQLHGAYAARVVEIHDPTGQGRVRVVVPQVHGTVVTGWAQPASVGAVAVGDRVYVAYDGGDVNYPVFWPVSLPTPAVLGAASAPGPWIPLVMAAGWVSQGAPNAPVSARWVNGTDVQLSGVASYTGGTALTGGTYYTVANLPAPMIPNANFNGPTSVSWDTGQTFVGARCQVVGGGTALQVVLPQTFTIRWVAFDSCFMRTV
jgi:hypothetical protein